MTEKGFITALLPMRAGSKRIPDKNLQILGGKPLFQRAIEALKKVPSVSRIIVDSDSSEILSGVKKLELDVITTKRPNYLGSDSTSMNDVLDRIIDIYPSEWYLQTHATSPFLDPMEVEQAVGMLLDSQDMHDSLFGASKIQGRLWTQEMEPINHNPSKLLPTQKLDYVLLENSSLYIFSRSSFMATQNRIGLRPLVYETSPMTAIDIDNPQDLDFARWIQNGVS